MLPFSTHRRAQTMFVFFSGKIQYFNNAFYSTNLLPCNCLKIMCSFSAQHDVYSSSLLPESYFPGPVITFSGRGYIVF